MHFASTLTVRPNLSVHKLEPKQIQPGHLGLDLKQDSGYSGNASHWHMPELPCPLDRHEWQVLTTLHLLQPQSRQQIVSKGRSISFR